jgi:hypothetical protein
MMQTKEPFMFNQNQKPMTDNEIEEMYELFYEFERMYTSSDKVLDKKPIDKDKKQ